MTRPGQRPSADHRADGPALASTAAAARPGISRAG